MLPYSLKPVDTFELSNQTISSFVSEQDANADKKVIKSFGEEWQRFQGFSEKEIEEVGNEYFDIVTDKHLNKDCIAMDVGCGTGRWSLYLKDKVKHIEAIDPSDAVISAQELTKEVENIRITQAGFDCIPFADNSFDFVMSLGVLHHVPDTQNAIQRVFEKIKKGGYFLGYIYYRFDNRNFIYKLIFNLSVPFRKIISNMPFFLKKGMCDLISALVYWPLAKFSGLLKFLLPKSDLYKHIPLNYYHNKSFYIMRNDALDRFGTTLEKRYTRKEITQMFEKAGFKNIEFSDKMPCWHFLAQKPE